MTALRGAATPAPLRVVVIGAGHIARLVHIPLLVAAPDVLVVAIADPAPDNLNAGLQLAPTARGFSDTRAALAAGGLDAAVLTLPSPLHAEAAIAALRAGLHVYIEKPLANSLPDAERVAEVWRASGRVGMVGFNFRFNPLFDEARAALNQWELGALVGIRTLFVNQRPRHGEWRRDPASGNNALLEFGPHHIDMLLHLIPSPVVEVKAFSHSNTDPQDLNTLLLRFQNGLVAQSTFAFGAPIQDSYEFLGDKAILRINRHDLSVEFIPAQPRRGKIGRLFAGLSGATRGLANGLRSKAEPSFALALDAFVQAARRNDATVHPNIEDGLATQRVLDAAARSIATGAPVSLPAPPIQAQPPQPSFIVEPKDGSSPALTIIIDKRTPFAALLPSLRPLSKQTIASQIELLFYAHEGDALADLDHEFLSRFERCTVLRHPGTYSESVYTTVHAAAAPIVCMYEDHVFPSPDWAAALVSECQSGCVAACTRVANANPGSIWSEVGFAVPYGFWTDPLHFDPADDVMVSNGAYRRDTLMALGGRLSALMRRAGGLNQVLRDNGGRFAIARTGVIAHANPSRPLAAIRLMFDVGRTYASRKRNATRMGFPERLFYVALGPIVPIQRFVERLPIMFSAGRNRKLRARILFGLAVGFMCEGLGRMAGYLFGEGRAAQRMESIDFDRRRHVRKADLALFAEETVSSE
ncbi:MAG: Gfo/Idh/MocA family oxidoreductase [Anaerolineae bacterium]|nr:MAG: Gfo/Idh/MocA family oxidoreductase [Anaerolineae bacterium]